jgi:putative hydrolase of the HAD superfamily
MKPTITTLLLDIGGVLLTNGWDRGSRRRAADEFDLDFDDMDERHHLTFDTYEEGRLTLDEYLDRVVFHRPRSFGRQRFKAFMFEQSSSHDRMIELTRSLKADRDLRTAAVSNEGRELTLHRIRTFGLATFIDCFVCSCFVQHRKPDTEIYRIALEMVQAAPAQAVYIDDRLLFVEVARTLGIHAIHHTGYEQTLRALSALDLAPAPAVPAPAGSASP